METPLPPAAGDSSPTPGLPTDLEPTPTTADAVGAEPAPTVDDTTGAAPEPAAAADPSRRRRRVKRLGIAVAVVALGVGSLGAGIAVDRVALTPAAVAPDPELALIGEAWNDIHEKYVDAKDLNDRDLAYAAIEGIVTAVGDTGHTSFLTPEELAQAHDSLSGSYVGVGIVLDVKDGLPVVTSVIHGGPAEAAHVQAGDRIVAVDGKPTKDLDIDAVAGMVRGTEGTQVTLTLERDGVAAPFPLTLTRAKIDLPAISWARIPGTDLVMLRIEQFSTGSADELKAALKDILATDASGIVLDLRGNPGGYVNEAVSAASEFLTSGDVHLSVDATGKETPTPVQPGGLAPNIPLVLLVDAGTASSSEIMTGALQDHGRATIVGETTFGTGTVLSEVPLSDGSALRIGVIEWLTPDGHEIWHHGITPDDVVALPSDVTRVVPDELSSLGASGLAKSGDSQLLKAIQVLDATYAGASPSPTVSPSPSPSPSPSTTPSS